MPKKQKITPDDLIPLGDWNPDAVRQCTACPLHECRGLVVLGEGRKHAKIVLVGEAPGYHEDNSGRPFMGDAGTALDGMLAEAGIQRRDTFVTNAVRCRPTVTQADGRIANKKPTMQQIRICRQHLLNELATLDPVVVVALGDSAKRALLPNDETNLTDLRGSVVRVPLRTRSGEREVPVIFTYHPAYALYDVRMRPSLVADLKTVVRLVQTAADQTAAEEPDTHDLTRTACRVYQTVAEVAALVEYLKAQPLVAFDTETSTPETGVKEAALDGRFARPICVSFTCHPGEGHVVPLFGQLPRDKWDAKAKNGAPAFRWEDLEEIWTPEEYGQVIDLLQQFFASNTPKTAQNGKYDLHALRNGGIPTVRRYVVDTLALHSLLHEDSLHGSETLRVDYTPMHRYDTWKQEAPSKSAPYALAPTEELWSYAASDTDVTYRACRALLGELSQAGTGLEWVHNHITQPLILAMYQVEREGFLVDRTALLSLQEKYHRWIREAELTLEAHAWPGFNPQSPAQVGRLLYGKRELPVLKYTDTGQPSTDAAVLEELFRTYSEDPVVHQLRRFRKLVKLRDTYLAGSDGRGGLMPFLDANGRIHSNYKIGRVPTGRLASENPNLQNIPKRRADILLDELVTEEDLAIRNIFRAPPGCVLGEGDYSMLEVRISALLWQETVLLQALERPDFDQHRLTASLVFKVPEEEVTKAQRTDAKRATFATQYGGGVSAVMRSTGWESQEASNFLNEMRRIYPATERGRSIVSGMMYMHGVVPNVYGRLRHFPIYRQVKDAASKRSPTGENGRARSEAGHMERIGFNFCSQSAGADTLSQALITLVLGSPALRKMGVRVCQTVHDSVNWYVPEAHAAEAAVVIKEVMEGVTTRHPHLATWRLPVEIEWGYSWGQMTEHYAAA